MNMFAYLHAYVYMWFFEYLYYFVCVSMCTYVLGLCVFICVCIYVFVCMCVCSCDEESVYFYQSMLMNMLLCSPHNELMWVSRWFGKGTQNQEPDTQVSHQGSGISYD